MRFYGDVPGRLEYPEISVYEAVETVDQF